MSRHRREILSLAFEWREGQWVWYSNAWSRGIIVTPDEREIYLAFKPLGFRKTIRGRKATEPRRPYWRTLKRMFGLDPDSSR